MGFLSGLRQFAVINRRLLPIKLHFILFNAGTSTVQPLMPLYAKLLHFSSIIVGTLYTIIPLGALVLKPTFCMLADKMKCHRGVLITWEIILFASFFCTQFIPADNSARPGSLYYNTSICSSPNSDPYFLVADSSSLWACDVTEANCVAWNASSACHFYNHMNLNATPHIFPDGNDICVSLPKLKGQQWKKQCTVFYEDGESSSPGYEQADSDTYQQWQFYVFLLCLMGSWVGNSVITTLNDTICIEICGDPSLYGAQRLWASIAWGIFSIINGLVIDAVSVEGEEKNYTPAFYLMLGPILIDIVLCYFLKFDIPKQSQSIALDVWKVFLYYRNQIFMFWCIMVGVSFGFIWNFLFWFLEIITEDLNDSSVTNNLKTIQGLVAGIETLIGETPAFFLGGWVVNRMGHGHSLSIVLGIIGLRFLLYSFLSNPWFCLPIEILQSNYGLFYSTMTSYAKKIAPPGTEASIQSILAAVCEGVGVAIGSYLGGVMFDAYGGNTTFLIIGICFFVSSVINEIIEYLYKIIDRRSTATNGPVSMPPTADASDESFLSSQ